MQRISEVGSTLNRRELEEEERRIYIACAESTPDPQFAELIERIIISPYDMEDICDAQTAFEKLRELIVQQGLATPDALFLTSLLDEPAFPQNWTDNPRQAHEIAVRMINHRIRTLLHALIMLSERIQGFGLALFNQLHQPEPGEEFCVTTRTLIANTFRTPTKISYPGWVNEPMARDFCRIDSAVRMHFQLDPTLATMISWASRSRELL